MKLDFLENYSDKDITYFLYGLFLGDGSYQNGFLKIAHTNKQRFYVEWVEEICKELNLQYCTKYDFTKKTTYGYYDYSRIIIKVPKKFYFETQNKCFDEFGKKIVSDYVLNNISEFGVLLWYLDDGNLSIQDYGKKVGRNAYLNTQSFSYEQNIKIAKMLNDRFGIKASINISGYSKNDKIPLYRLRFSATSFRKFIDLVRPYIKYVPEEFLYKFNMKYKPNKLKNSVEFSEKYNFI